MIAQTRVCLSTVLNTFKHPEIFPVPSKRAVIELILLQTLIEM